MYEGEQNGNTVKVVIDTLIKNAGDDFYSNIKVTTKNFSGIDDKTINDSEDYLKNLAEIKSRIEEGATYNISFGYNTLKTSANEVIIEKIK